MTSSICTLPDNPNLRRCYLPERLRQIVLGAGHPWGAQAFFARVPGVAEVVCGYANGTLPNASFASVDSGKGAFCFAQRIKYDPDRLPLERLLEIFFLLIDPCAKGHQGYDWGLPYRSGVYYTDERDLPVIEAIFQKVRGKAPGRITTELLPLNHFVVAEDEQQNYLERHPDAYCACDLGLLERIGDD